MDKAQLLEQIIQWRETEEFDKIAEAILAVPQAERDYELTRYLAQAYNSLKNYKEAGNVLKTIEEQGQQDPAWHLCQGISRFGMNMFQQAKESFEKVHQMAPKMEIAAKMVKRCDDCMEKEYWSKEFGEGRALDPDKTLEYILNYNLHGSFAVEDIIEDDHIVIPAWDVTIYPEIADLKEQSVVLTFTVTSPKWDREVVEHCASMGSTPKHAIGMACGSFLFAVMNGIAAMETEQRPVALESQLAGKTHTWKAYRSNILAMGHTPKMNDFDCYWNELKEDLAKHLGNQKLCYVKVYAAKNKEKVTGECRINDVRVESLSKKVVEMASKWETNDFGSQKQFFFLKQDEATTLLYPFDQEQLEERTQAAIRLFHSVKTKEEYKQLPHRLDKMAGDMSLGTELFLFLPEMCAENGFNRFAYPETITFRYPDHEETVYRTQLASYYTIKQALFWCLQNRIFGEETDLIYQELVSASAVFSMIQQAKEQGKSLSDGSPIGFAFQVDEGYKIR